jgi:hypothetical protein
MKIRASHCIIAGGSIDPVPSGNRGRYPSENQEFFHACGLRGTRNGCLLLDTAYSWETILEYHRSDDCCSARIIMLNMSRKEETFIFKPEGTKKCNQVMVTIRPERNAMAPDKKPSAAENFSTKLSRRIKNTTPVATRSPVASVN